MVMTLWLLLLHKIAMVAVAESNLAYSLGLSQMGRMVTYARYGADIFDALDEDDD